MATINPEWQRDAKRKKDDEILRDGESVRVPLMAADRAALDSCCRANAALARQQASRDEGFAAGAEIVKAIEDAESVDDNGQSAYERRIREAWKHRHAH